MALQRLWKHSDTARLRFGAPSLVDGALWRSRATLAFEEYVASPGGHDEADKANEPRTAVVLHGVLGSARNFRTFVKRLADKAAAADAASATASAATASGTSEAASDSNQTTTSEARGSEQEGARSGLKSDRRDGGGGRAWRFLSVDLRCHGRSARLPGFDPPHTIEAAATDVLELVRHKLGSRRLDALVGHSLGGKVALAALDQFVRGVAPKGVAAPSQVWVLDAYPGHVHAGVKSHDMNTVTSVMTAIQAIPLPIPSVKWLQEHLAQKGFTQAMIQWLVSSLVPDGHGAFTWIFDLQGAHALYKSYGTSDYWHLIERPGALPEGTDLHVVRAEHSDRLAGRTLRRLEAAAGGVATAASSEAHHPSSAGGTHGRTGLASGGGMGHPSSAGGTQGGTNSLDTSGTHDGTHGGTHGGTSAAASRPASRSGRFHLHLLPKSGHWVHADNPTGLKAIMVPYLVGHIGGTA